MVLTSTGCGSSDSASENATIYLFSSGSTSLNVGNGTLTRSAVNAACVSGGAPTACTHKTAAFMSFSSSDQISGFATQLSLPSGTVVGPTGTLIADSWTALLQGTLKATPITAGAFPVSATYYPTASNADGSYNSSYDCTGWTGTGFVGMGDGTQTNHLAIYGATASCNGKTILCLCY